MSKNVGLIILDGWGIGDKSKSDAIFNADTPYMDYLMQAYPTATLKTFGEEVGLPDGQMGNSEVGHLNIGAGRVVYQELTRINKAIREGEFFKNEVLLEAFHKAKNENRTIHFIGLVSKGGVHSSQEHLYALCKMAADFGISESYIHAFTDGRDCDPKSGFGYMQELLSPENIRQTKVASIVGRYYAMDRDRRWERIKKAYDVMVNAQGQLFESPAAVFEASYAAGITDEFIEPVVLCENGLPLPRIKDGDVVISFNFRTDRPREISEALTQQDFHEQNMHKLAISYYTMTNYDSSFHNVRVIFDKDNLSNTLGEVLSKLNKSQVRIAETEKYPHVTFFFSGGREENFRQESRILIASPKVATYDLQPEMSAYDVRDKIVSCIHTQKPNFFCLNFANPDMVGHTGVYEAIVKAVEAVDSCLKDVVEAAKSENYEVIVIADHGNADYAINPDGSPNTAHSLNPVPFVLVTESKIQLENGILADVAPTILDRMQLASPIEMTGKSLVKTV
ncbi:MAG: phosphoglycerate mutase [Crocinitomicaceae bacterium]|jgi:2,3-bisphosphoglycerate-independent phosphoglycerate mutase|nr:phosphoglycerate mutase [Crocinitomicaceae bacterium]